MLDSARSLLVHDRLMRNARLSRDELERLQLKGLKRLVRHAYDSVPYYKRLFRSANLRPEDIKSVEDLCLIPVSTKADLQANAGDMISTRVDPSSCVRQRTSGSSGMPMEFVYTPSDARLKKMTFLRIATLSGYRLYRDRLLRVTAPDHIPKKTDAALRLFARNGYLSVRDDMDTQVKILEAFNPDVLNGYPLSIRFLAEEVKRRGIKLRTRLNLTGSELLDANTRKIIESAFGEVIDGYGTTEAGGMSWECREHTGYHIGIDTCVLEFLKDGEPVAPGETGEVAVTSLHSYAMPLIRYNLGDAGIPIDGDDRCPCGSQFPLMKVLQGRSNDFLKMPDGEIIPPSRVNVRMNDYVSEISCYRIVQEKRDRFMIELVKGPGYIGDTQARIRSSLCEVLGEVSIEFRLVDGIKREKSGKIRMLISKVR